MAAGVHVPLRFLRAAMKKGIQLLKTKLPAAQVTSKVALEPIYARIPVQNSHLHPSIRQRIGGRWYSTSVNNLLRFAAEQNAPRLVRQPSVRAAIGRSPVSAPFASTLRPTLTGGVFPRTASGYSLGGGARFFSHSPAAPAQVMSQVSAAMRAFMYSGKGQLDAHRHGNSKLGVRAQLAASISQENAPGAYIDFDLSPTFTCISPLVRSNATLENAEFLQSMSADFGAMIGAMTAIYSDIRRLSTLGDLPVSLVGQSSDVLRVRFSGCDREFVEVLCDEVGVRRGVVHEDERFAFDMLAPGVTPSWKDMMSNASPPLSSTYSEDGFEDASDEDLDMINSKISTGSDYFDPIQEAVMVDSPGHSSSSSGDYGGLQGIHHFLEECDEYRHGMAAWR
ncbi:hypothetical protein EDC01DRAFT_710682 [Geopyxis carbonaria]|nr:hypothetical protein EDC01DRAFT_710682 [Geopyxis carbonaria]